MTNKNKIFIGILVLILAVSVWVFKTSSELTRDLKEIPVENKNTQVKDQVKADEIVITETKDGQKFWEIYAQSSIYDADEDLLILKNVKGNFYRDQKVAMSFIAPFGTYNEKTKKVKLTGGTDVVTSNKMRVFAKNISWTGSKDVIFADGDVKIKQTESLLTLSNKAEFSSNFSDIKIIGKTKTILYKNDD